MAKNKLTAETPVGLFTRDSNTKYTHIVVWNSPRAMKTFANPREHESGVHARWVKDRGYGVTWHGSAAAAQAAAKAGYKWDAATLVGVFAVAIGQRL